MKNSIKKIMVCVLCTVMIIAALPVSAVSGNVEVNAEKLFTSPIVAENIQYSYEISQPTLSVPTKEYYAPYFGDTVVSSAPVISEITANAAPNDGIVIEGKGFTDATVYTFGLASNGDGVYRKAEIANATNTTITAVIDEGYAYGMYLVWVENANGMSYPVRVNAPEIDWIGKSTADNGESVSIYGENLSYGNVNDVAYVYIKGYGYAEVTEVNPYKVTFTVPSDITNGDYAVYVHNGHGGKYGFSNAGVLSIDSSAPAWTGTKVSVSGNGIATAITSANEYDTIYFPNGTYTLSETIAVDKALKFVGESEEGVILKAGFAGKVFDMTDAFSFENITFEDVTEADVSSPVFINANNTDGAVILNCSFIKHKTYSLKCTDEAYNADDYADIGNGYGTGNIPAIKLSDTAVGGCVNLDTVSNLVIEGCYFFAPRGVDISKADGAKISNNEFYGTWIMDSSNGPMAVKVNTGSRLDISDNGIYGADKLVDPTGKLSTKDLTFDRSIAIQSPYGTVNGVYIANNNMERVGAETGNAGEQILLEEYGITYKGTPAAVSGNTITFADTAWFTDTDGVLKGYDVCGEDVSDNGSAREIVGQTVVIVHGNGASQYRKITAATENTITVDKAWDIAPNEESLMMIVRQYENITVYNNTFIGPDDYDKYSGHSTAIQAWANFFDFRVTENTIKNFAYGMQTTPHYTYAKNRKAYNVLEDVIISGNDVSNSTHGISVWFALSNIDGVNNDYNFDGEPAFVQQNTVIRRNNIHDIVDTLSDELVPAGQGITVGTYANEYKDWTDEEGGLHNIWDNASIHQGKWVKNTLVENNTFANNAGADIELQYHQGDTILRDNTYSASNKVVYSTAPSGAPAVYKAVDYTTPASNDQNVIDIIVADNGYGSFVDGLTGKAETKTAQDKLYNGDFEQGLAYWGRLTGRTDSTKASDVASAQIEDNGNTYLHISKTAEETEAKSVRSVPFKVTGLKDGDFVTFLYRYRYQTSASVSTKVSLNVLSGDAKFYAGNPIANLDSGVSKKIVTSDFLDTTGDWTWSTSEIVPNSSSRYMTSVPESGEVTFDVQVYVNNNDVCELDIDDVTVIVKRFGNNATPTGYWETLDGNWLKDSTYAPYYGTSAGVSGNASQLIAIDTYNGDFEKDFTYWGDNKNGNTIKDTVTIVNENGNKYLSIYKDSEFTDALGIKSVPFKLPNLKAGDNVYIISKVQADVYKTETDASSLSSIIISATADSSIFATISNTTNTLQQNIASSVNMEGFTVCKMNRSIAADTNNATLYLNAYVNGNAYGTVYIDDIQILIEHKSGEVITPSGFYHDIYGNLVKASNYTIYTEEDGIYGIGYNNENTSFLNGDFEQGFKYWGSDKATDFATNYADVVTDSVTGNKYIEINALNSSYTPAITSYKFPMEGLQVNDIIGVMIKVKDKNSETVTRGNITVDLVPVDSTVTLNNRTNLASSPCYNMGDGWYLWTTSQSNYKVTAIDSAKTPYFYVKLNGNRTYSGTICVDDVKVFKIVEGGDKIIGDSHSISALQTTDGEIFNARSGLPLYGTKENGMYLADSQNKIDCAQYIALKEQINPFDFETNGFKYWGSYFNGNNNTQASALTFASDYAAIKNGAITLTDKGISQGGIATAMLKVENNPNLVLIYENSGNITDATAAGNNRGEIGFVSKGNTVKTSLNNTNGSVVKNVLEIGNKITASADGETYGYFYMFATTGFNATVKNLRYGYKDIGGMANMYTEADGSPYGYSMGDANADGSVDIRDLVRMKKYSANNETPIYFAAANFDKSTETTISATDLSLMRIELLSK